MKIFETQEQWHSWCQINSNQLNDYDKTLLIIEFSQFVSRSQFDFIIKQLRNAAIENRATPEEWNMSDDTVQDLFQRCLDEVVPENKYFAFSAESGVYECSPLQSDSIIATNANEAADYFSYLYGEDCPF